MGKNRLLLWILGGFALLTLLIIGAIVAWDDAGSRPTQAAESACVLQGVVVDGAGKPIDGAVVRDGARKATTGDGGHFHLPCPGPDGAELDVTASGYAHPEPAADSPLRVDPLGDESIRLILHRVGEISGTVSSGEGPVAEAQIDVEWLACDWLGTPLPAFSRRGAARSDAQGRFRLRDLPPGTLLLSAKAAGQTAAATAQVTLEDGGQLPDVVLHFGGVAAAKAPVVPVGVPATAGPADGTVLQANGQPGRDAIVVVTGPGIGQQLRTDIEGHFRVQGDAKALIGAQAVAVTDDQAPSEPVTIRANTPIILKLGLGGYISGKVVDSRGQGLGAQVTVDHVEAKGPLPQLVPMHAQLGATPGTGAFRIGPFRPGTYDLHAEIPGLPVGRLGGIEVTSGGDTQGVVLTLQDGARVVGRITSAANGQSVVGAEVVVTEPGSARGITKKAKTNAQGEYVLEHVSAGPHTVTAQAEGFVTESASGVVVPETGEVHKDLALEASAGGRKVAFQGIGAGLARTPEGVVIGWTMPDSPAAKAGLQSGDVIKRIDGKDVSSMQVPQIVELIRGEPGTQVNIEVDAQGGGHRALTIGRARIINQGE